MSSSLVSNNASCIPLIDDIVDGKNEDDETDESSRKISSRLTSCCQWRRLAICFSLILVLTIGSVVISLCMGHFLILYALYFSNKEASLVETYLRIGEAITTGRVTHVYVDEVNNFSGIIRYRVVVVHDDDDDEYIYYDLSFSHVKPQPVKHQTVPLLILPNHPDSARITSLVWNYSPSIRIARQILCLMTGLGFAVLNSTFISACQVWSDMTCQVWSDEVGFQLKNFIMVQCWRESFMFLVMFPFAFMIMHLYQRCFQSLEPTKLVVMDPPDEV
mmetsp:Transcript_8736/g.15853  ORF Transcript_8736/g.15853 Transcript_8736/m.15853 type:complete len:275 (-) Transcript_8736:144-968(-)|eukprot:CAMPEP_0198301206 /NCGR_PEP_ID=MMETSP1449-20131203/50771_1 /TAXON_ID=420275 /ORGANISM="Attheya septentrionalis, Strain CCMP2084" /LENGTH=274 /DNA_ID=CAMNT_0044003223 /DNA_START=93 /DNA_END=917 /DNA_ORIENTATION=-